MVPARMINLPQLACREKPYQSGPVGSGLSAVRVPCQRAVPDRAGRARCLGFSCRAISRSHRYAAPDAIFPGHVLIPLRPRETTLKPAGKFPLSDKKSGCNGRNGGPAVPFVDQPKMRTSAMTARRWRDRGARRPREIMHRRSRAFDDDPGADEFDEWMAACPPADTSQPSS